MKKLTLAPKVVLCCLSVLTFSVLAHAQNNRTWVSGQGNDANAATGCLVTAPCRTFAGAIAVTNAGGEISVRDAGDFGPVTITKSMTINGTGSLSAASCPTCQPFENTGVINVAAGAADDVILRNLSFAGNNNTRAGVRYVSGRELEIEQCWFSGFVVMGVEAALTTAGNLKIVDTIIENLSNPNAQGVHANTTFAGPEKLQVTIDNVKVQNLAGTNASGFQAFFNVRAQIRDSYFTGNTFGIAAGTGATPANGSIIDVDDSHIAFNFQGLRTNPNQTIRVSNSMIVSNFNNLASGGGNLVSLQGNSVTGHSGGGDGAFTATVVKQ